ncbi:conserved phage C-terminal domain-containing protein [Turicibacter sanguinis]|uniref:conserved phage C-terminal domain-containing protein n=1 Tax=Turicibacter sanguinis TaxID=154288 RepID=UPI00241D7D9D|nr:conserved phage C-terminal domain-containing protein [Turicibacter sanguinis]
MNYLINEPPLVLLPSLATAIGLNEALMLQQIQYWLSRSDKEIDGRYWIYNTYEAWIEQFPFWSKPTIVRTIMNLEKTGVVLTANYNKAKFDKTKWYTIDYDRLREIIETTDVINMSKRCYQNDKTMLSNCIDGDNQNDNTYTRYYTDTTTDTTQIDNVVFENDQHSKSKKNEEKHFVEQGSTTSIPYDEIVAYLNQVRGTNLRQMSSETAHFIKSKIEQGYTLDDFKKVIEIKNSSWSNAQAMVGVPNSLLCLHFVTCLKEGIIKPKGNDIHAEILF